MKKISVSASASAINTAIKDSFDNKSFSGDGNEWTWIDDQTPLHAVRFRDARRQRIAEVVGVKLEVDPEIVREALSDILDDVETVKNLRIGDLCAVVGEKLVDLLHPETAQTESGQANKAES